MIDLATHLTHAVAALPLTAQPLPKPVQDDLDTVKEWLRIIGGSIGVIALMLLGISMWVDHRGNHGGEFVNKMLKWVLGAGLVSGATLIAPVFLG